MFSSLRLSTLLWALVGPVSVAAQDQADGGARPNILVVLCDDLGYGDLACYGHPHIRTPNLDRMAREGVRLTDCYSAAPVCSPSRVGLLTGRSPNRAGVYDWIPAGKKTRPDAREQVHMRASEITIPALLKQAGYATCMAGKWHCNAQFNSDVQPQPGDFGFDHWLATQNNARPSHEDPRNFVRNGESVGPLEGYSCQLVADEVIGWLEEHAEDGAGQPFFVYMAFHEPHEPVASPPELVAGYEDVAEAAEQAQYFANVQNMDLAVGKVMAALQRLQVDENTLVVFTSDNGPETLRRYRGAGRSWGSPAPLRGMKLWTTEAGFRVAGIMRWPGRLAGGQESGQVVSSLDLLPTFCALAGAKVPEDLALDGTDIQVLFDGREVPREKPLFWCYFNALNERRVAMRDGVWKVLAKLDGGAFPKMTNVHDGNIAAVQAAELTDFQLFRLADGVSEATDLGEQFPEKLAEMRGKLVAAYRSMAATSHYWKR